MADAVLFASRSARETKRLAAVLLRRPHARHRRPLIFALAGDLGSGKTTFVQGLAAALGVREPVRSPTFVLMKWYRLPRAAPNGFRHFVHVDAYRMERPAEARHLGLAEAFRDRDAVVAIEWAERIRKLIPPHAMWVRFRHAGALGRIISVGAPLPRYKGRRMNARRTGGI